MKKIYAFVEGDDDERFFKNLFSKSRIKIKFIQYAQTKNNIVNEFIKVAKNQKNMDYVFFADIDNLPCVTSKKAKLKKEYKNLEESKVIIVIKEIESWYLAGLDVSDYKKLGFKHSYSNTDNITKEKFNNLIPKKESRILFMRKILKNFSIDIANKRNKSFKYFNGKYKDWF